MGTAGYATEEQEPTPLDVKRAPFAQVLVTLSKQERTQLVWDARYWKKAHQRAIARAQQLEAQHRLALEQAALREASLRSDLEAAQAKIRDLKKRVFGRKSEHSSHAGKAPGLKSSRLRGQQPGAPGHGRTMQVQLAAHIETIGADSAQCPSCGLEFADFPGTEDSEVLEIEVKAYRRVIRRRRYRKVCQCEGVPGIITAPSPALWPPVRRSRNLAGSKLPRGFDRCA